MCFSSFVIFISRPVLQILIFDKCPIDGVVDCVLWAYGVWCHKLSYIFSSKITNECIGKFEWFHVYFVVDVFYFVYMLDNLMVLINLQEEGRAACQLFVQNHCGYWMCHRNCTGNNTLATALAHSLALFQYCWNMYSSYLLLGFIIIICCLCRTC